MKGIFKKMIATVLAVCTLSVVGLTACQKAPAVRVEATESTVTTWDSSVVGTGLTASFDSATGVLTIALAEGATEGAMTTGWTASKVPWYSEKSKIVSVVLPEGLTNIGKFAFNQCSSLNSITIPSTVTEIGEKAFYACDDLTEVVIPEAVTIIYANAFNSSANSTKKVTILGLNTKINAISSFGTNTTIYGYMGSKAETWAKENGRAFVALDSVFKETSVSIGASLTLHYFVQLSDENINATMDFSVNDYSKTGVIGQSVGDLYQFSFTGIAPQWIGDTVTATLKNGETEIETKEYSVQAYCKTLLNSSASDLGISETKFTALKTLANDLLNYGAAAQVYTVHNTDNLANAEVTEGSVFATITNTDSALYGTALDGVAFTGANLYFNNTNKLYFYFTAEDTAGLYAIVTKNGVPVKTVTSFIAQNGAYMLATDDIFATEFDAVFAVTLYRAQDGVDMQGQTFTYSVKSYVVAKQNETENETLTALANLVRTLWLYGESAKAYAKA